MSCTFLALCQISLWCGHWQLLGLGSNDGLRADNMALLSIKFIDDESDASHAAITVVCPSGRKVMFSGRGAIPWFECFDRRMLTYLGHRIDAVLNSEPLPRQNTVKRIAYNAQDVMHQEELNQMRIAQWGRAAAKERHRLKRIERAGIRSRQIWDELKRKCGGS